LDFLGGMLLELEMRRTLLVREVWNGEVSPKSRDVRRREKVLLTREECNDEGKEKLEEKDGNIRQGRAMNTGGVTARGRQMNHLSMRNCQIMNV
jgi:hypothetical protein